jgi:diguanylate cyclase (GGDEF)-like protein
MVNDGKPISELNIFELLDLEREIVDSIKRAHNRPSECRSLWRTHKQVIQRLTDFAIRDPLTHLLNRNGYQALTEGLIEQSAQRNKNFAHVIFDIDDFRKVNTNYGHDIGDKILQKCAGILLEELRTPSYNNGYAAILRGEHPIRMGGEEIAVLLPNRTTKTGKKAAEHFRRLIESSRAERLPMVTVSGGVASFETVMKAYRAHNTHPTDDDIAEALYVFSDYALYHSKDTGKNKITTFEESMKEPISRERKKRLGDLTSLALAYQNSQVQ